MQANFFQPVVFAFLVVIGVINVKFCCNLLTSHVKKTDFLPHCCCSLKANINNTAITTMNFSEFAVIVFVIAMLMFKLLKNN